MSKKEATILIVDDDEIILLSIKLLLEQHFKNVVTLNDPVKIPQTLDSNLFDVVLLDMNFKQGETSGKEGIKWLKKIKSSQPEASVLLMTAYGEVDLAVDAMKEGASDFVIKPWQNEKLLATVMSAFNLSQEHKKVTHLRSQQKIITSTIDYQFGELIGKSKPMQEVFTMIKKVATTDADVLILGENGTGKEIAARAIHKNSKRFNEVFISVDLGAIPENLFESELFGHKKGAFTDAKEDRIGRLEAATGGTLFLDEIGNLSPSLQSKLLTVLQNREVVRLGTNSPKKVDVRLICATNSNLIRMVKEGQFREDLLYRINTVEITMPPLREKSDDIPLLTEYFLKKYCKKYHKENLKMPEYVVKKLQKYTWPGNIRELQHAIERAVIMADSVELKATDFTFLIQQDGEEGLIDNYNLENLEAWAIKNALKKHQGNVSHAAKELGLSRGAMYRRMEKYDI